MLKPSIEEVSLPPPIYFLRCTIYQYFDDKAEKRALLVEDFLQGKFTKFKMILMGHQSNLSRIMTCSLILSKPLVTGCMSIRGTKWLCVICREYWTWRDVYLCFVSLTQPSAPNQRKIDMATTQATERRIGAWQGYVISAANMSAMLSVLVWIWPTGA